MILLQLVCKNFMIFFITLLIFSGCSASSIEKYPGLENLGEGDSLIDTSNPNDNISKPVDPSQQEIMDQKFKKMIAGVYQSGSYDEVKKAIIWLSTESGDDFLPLSMKENMEFVIDDNGYFKVKEQIGAFVSEIEFSFDKAINEEQAEFTIIPRGTLPNLDTYKARNKHSIVSFISNSEGKLDIFVINGDGKSEKTATKK